MNESLAQQTLNIYALKEEAGGHSLTGFLQLLIKTDPKLLSVIQKSGIPCMLRLTGEGRYVNKDAPVINFCQRLDSESLNIDVVSPDTEPIIIRVGLAPSLPKVITNSVSPDNDDKTPMGIVLFGNEKWANCSPGAHDPLSYSSNTTRWAKSRMLMTLFEATRPYQQEITDAEGNGLYYNFNIEAFLEDAERGVEAYLRYVQQSLNP